MNKEEFLNLEIGKTFTIGNKKFKVEKGTCCDDCCFAFEECIVFDEYNLRPKCENARKNSKRVIFVEVV